MLLPLEQKIMLSVVWHGLVLISLLLNFLLADESGQLADAKYECPINSYCKCFENKNDGGHQYHCDYNDITIEIKVTEEENQINCHIEGALNVANYSNWTDILVDLKLSGSSSFRITRCTMPNIPIRDIFRKNNVPPVKTIILDQMKILPGIFDKPLFENLSFVEKLIMKDNDKLGQLKDFIFNGLSNVSKVLLTRNQISEISNYAFCNTSISQLDIGENLLQKFKPGVFDCTPNLTSLNLFKNKLGDSLNSDLFKNTPKISSIDLNSNGMTKISEDLFRNLLMLKDVNLNSNNINSTDQNAFSYLQYLDRLRLSNNNVQLQLPDYLFAKLTSLTELHLNGNRLTSVPSNLISQTTNLLSLQLKNNYLTWLPGTVFQNNERLQKLYLSWNRLTNFNKTTFSHLRALEKLDLSHNMLAVINEAIFDNLRSLKELDLSYNKLKFICGYCFRGLNELQDINLSNNQLIMTEQSSPLQLCMNLRQIDLHNNLIKEIKHDWRKFTRINLLNLADNMINKFEVTDNFLSPYLKVDLSSNNITELEGMEVLSNYAKYQCADPNHCEPEELSNRNLTVVLTGNPLHCDCGVFELANYVKKKMAPEAYKFINIVTTDIYCAEPDNMKNVPLDQIDLNDICCDFNKFTNSQACNPFCRCTYYMLKNTLQVNCSNANLNQFPSQLSEIPTINVELLLSNNQINSMEAIDNSYENVTRMDLSYNNIESVNVSSFPKKLEEIILDHNKITKVDANSIKAMSKLKTMTLHNNPWHCDCEAIKLKEFVNKYELKIKNANDIRCTGNNETVANFTESKFCYFMTHVIIAAIIFAILGLLSAVLMAFYHRYEHEIKVWLFSHRLFLNLVTEKELDKSKLYDAFISYSHQDENFIIDHLVPGLETGPSQFKLCLHYRDWIPGEWITEQIIKSVENSRRTIVVLSSNFLNSVWGKMEFRMAYMKAMKEKCTRLIIILYEDVDPALLDNELKAYLNTTTYLKWGDPWFWQKLRYALPHPQEFSKKVPMLSAEKHVRLKRIGKTLVTYSKSNTAPLANVPELVSDQEEKIRQLKKLYE